MWIMDGGKVVVIFEGHSDGESKTVRSGMSYPQTVDRLQPSCSNCYTILLSLSLPLLNICMRDTSSEAIMLLTLSIRMWIRFENVTVNRLRSTWTNLKCNTNGIVTQFSKVAVIAMAIVFKMTFSQPINYAIEQWFIWNGEKIRYDLFAIGSMGVNSIGRTIQGGMEGGLLLRDRRFIV